VNISSLSLGLGGRAGRRYLPSVIVSPSPNSSVSNMTTVCVWAKPTPNVGMAWTTSTTCGLGFGADVCVERRWWGVMRLLNNLLVGLDDVRRGVATFRHDTISAFSSKHAALRHAVCVAR